MNYFDEDVQLRRRLATADDARWAAVLGARSRGRRPVRLCRQLDRHLLPAVVPEPPAPPRPRRVLRRASRRTRGGIPRVQALQAGCGRRRTGSLGREDPARLRVSLERRGSSLAGHARGAPRRQPVPPAAQLQAARRRHAARIRGRLPAAQGEGAPAAGGRRSPARCSTPATDRAAASTSARCRSSGWRRRSIAAAAPACRSATRSSTRRTLARPAARRGDAARRVRGGDGIARTRARRVRCRASIRRPRSAADAGALAQWTKAILAHLAGRAPRLDLPLDVQATAFQWQVWQALASIPYGETRTYSDVAAAIGKPRAVRAVARACATNPVALAIPCHRVVPPPAARAATGGARSGRRSPAQAGRAGWAGRSGRSRRTGRSGWAGRSARSEATMTAVAETIV